MQNFIDQAHKNGVILLRNGKCQCCGADYQQGIFDCMENYNNGFELLDFTDPAHHESRFLSVDAHALQHPEIHGRWSNHFHLTRLNLLLDKNQTWNYQKSPMLSDYLNAYKQNRPNEFLAVPKPQERGLMTAKDLTKATTPQASVEQIKKWAVDVYHAWIENHLLVSQIADGFLEQLYNRKATKR
jgi:Family of unknown function (DUF5946)